MRITELPAYKRLEENFKQKGYSKGIEETINKINPKFRRKALFEILRK